MSTEQDVPPQEACADDLVDLLVDRERKRAEALRAIQRHRVGDHNGLNVLELRGIDGDQEVVVDLTQALRSHIASGESAATFFDQYPQFRGQSLGIPRELMAGGEEVPGLFPEGLSVGRSLRLESGQVEVPMDVVGKSASPHIEIRGEVDEETLQIIDGMRDSHPAVHRFLSGEGEWVEHPDSGELFASTRTVTRLMIPTKEDVEWNPTNARMALTSTYMPRWLELSGREDPKTKIKGHGISNYYPREAVASFARFLQDSVQDAIQRSTYTLATDELSGDDGASKKK